MDIQNLKTECNSLIDEVMKLQKIDRELDLEIRKLQEEIGQRTEAVREEKEVSLTESAEIPEEDIPEPAGKEQQEPAEVLAQKNPESDEPEPVCADSGNMEMVATEADESEADEPEDSEEKTPEKSEEMAPETEPEKPDSTEETGTEPLSLKQEAPGLPPKEQQLLAQQVSLLSGGTGKDIVIVYEMQDRGRGAKNVIKTMLFIISLFAFAAAAVLLLYYTGNGVI